MAHIWLRAEQRAHEERAGLTPQGAASLIAAGHKLTVEDSRTRAIPTQDYAAAGAEIVPEASWPSAPADAIIFGLKELPEDGTPLRHRHIMFGHAYKGQYSGKQLLQRFKAGGGSLYDIEYLVDDSGRRLAAFGYWAGFAGAAVTVKAWIAQQQDAICGPVATYRSKDALLGELTSELAGLSWAMPRALIIGALGRVGTGATDLCRALSIPVTRWDIAETAHGGPFPQILEHEMLFNCILASEGVPQFVPGSALTAPRRLTAIGDIACDPDSSYNPIAVYNQATTWEQPVVRVHDDPVLDVMAIDNLPSLLPVESSDDFAGQLLPSLKNIDRLDAGAWARAKAVFDKHVNEV